ncbi:hypothetical protein [Pectobacterium carotovorum]|uniref:hypothetical protein n=1 Tax=Pectobacterium carotovorum TaxID=554 RepID=UPI0005077CF0|nr:hypothetical protein [Pectobacterium carotovorum]KFX02286.1 hypothetical protein JV33_03960 [Pectobacterium carotovorum subsp. carotovorum]KML72144.1 hypothetical protein G032_03480 [Pectobacterium carotovorum subsp. carotovorum ICMP 5702]MBA0177192.1 hypothetical protein [Pectobacterium carotovorum]SHG41983.1 hypothetical protein SAMN05444147_102472 [Pectobacterium carotovorum]
MSNFKEMDAFERFTKLKDVTAQEMALAILGINPFADPKDIPKDIEKDVFQLRTILRQNAGSNINRNLQHNERIDAKIYFAESYKFISTDDMPKPIFDKCHEVINNIAREVGWKEKLLQYGDDELIEYGRSIRKSGRGIYRQEHEKENTDKLLALLIMLLADKLGNKYGTAKEPSKREIYRDLVSLAEKESVSLKGIKESSFYNKVKKSFNSLFSE